MYPTIVLYYARTPPDNPKIKTAPLPGLLLFGAGGGTWTHTTIHRLILSQVRLPFRHSGKQTYALARPLL